MATRIGRKRFIGMVAATLLSVPAWARQGRVEATTQDNCFWQKQQGPICSGGQSLEYWCFICCAGGVCEVSSCEWRVVGSC